MESTLRPVIEVVQATVIRGGKPSWVRRAHKLGEASSSMHARFVAEQAGIKGAFSVETTDSKFVIVMKGH